MILIGALYGTDQDFRQVSAQAASFPTQVSVSLTGFVLVGPTGLLQRPSFLPEVSLPF